MGPKPGKLPCRSRAPALQVWGRGRGTPPHATMAVSVVSKPVKTRSAAASARGTASTTCPELPNRAPRSVSGTSRTPASSPRRSRTPESRSAAPTSSSSLGSPVAEAATGARRIYIQRDHFAQDVLRTVVDAVADDGRFCSQHRAVEHHRARLGTPVSATSRRRGAPRSRRLDSRWAAPRDSCGTTRATVP
jgi:hypothetical protein